MFTLLLMLYIIYRIRRWYRWNYYYRPFYWYRPMFFFRPMRFRHYGIHCMPRRF